MLPIKLFVAFVAALTASTGIALASGVSAEAKVDVQDDRTTIDAMLEDDMGRIDIKIDDRMGMEDDKVEVKTDGDTSNLFAKVKTMSGVVVVK